VEKSISQLMRGRTLIRSVPAALSTLSVMVQSIVIRLEREGTQAARRRRASRKDLQFAQIPHNAQQFIVPLSQQVWHGAKTWFALIGFLSTSTSSPMHSLRGSSMRQ
jgi:hypothetical protein